MADTNLLNVEWRFHEWIMGVGGLTPDNVLDYFAQSPFWDSSCNNAIIRMQTQFNNLGEMTQKLREQTGMEFALVHERYPALFIIQKQERKGPDYVIPMDIYYVLNGSIYMNPDLQTLLSNRVLGSLFYVESAFNEARTMTEFHPSTGYHWKAPAETVAAAGAAGAGSATPALPGLDAIIAPGAIGSAPPKAESKEFCAAVDRAFKSVEQQMHIKQLMVQAGNATAAGAAGVGAGAGADAKVKQEGHTQRHGQASQKERGGFCSGGQHGYQYQCCGCFSKSRSSFGWRHAWRAFYTYLCSCQEEKEDQKRRP
ncbi:MAG: MED6 mediator sub complex component-domain-containing protein [Linnemannia gamsii]|nr:MAG: MED6 mediator sub complex component-domain-containing protein [Linnemannia gamsii]